MKPVSGLHHVTAIAGPAQENLDFYAGVLGMRLVKKSVNQDDPGTYHLFYADAEGHPGTDLTFFPWADLAPSRDGYGLSTEVSLAVPPGSLDFWSARLARYGARVFDLETRFGQRVLPLADPHGLRIALTESEIRSPRRSRVTGSDGSEVRFRSSIRFAAWKAREWSSAILRRPFRFWPTHWAFGKLVKRTAGSVMAWARGSRVNTSICAPRRMLVAAPGARAASIILPGEWTTKRISSKCASKS